MSLAVAAFVVCFSARPFFVSAWRHLRQGALVMDLPVALAIGLAFLASAWATWSGQGQVYFDSVVMFTFFLLLGRFLEHRARRRQDISWADAEDSLPAAVSTWSGDRWETVPRARLRVGDRILVRAGETVPVDAQLDTGGGAVKEDTFNGEQLPRQVAPGDTLYAGTIAVAGALEARVLANYADTRLAALQHSVDLAQGEKPPLVQLADRVAAWFIGAILLIAAATALLWSQLDPTRALWVTLSVLVISCPCALALATPAALASAAAALRARGIIVRGENALEALARATHVIFDKTGTLTEGRLSLARVDPLADTDPDECLAIAAALQRYACHPVAQAFQGIEAAAGFSAVDYTVGAGLNGSRQGIRYRMGSEGFCRQLAATLPPPPDGEHYWTALCRDDQPLAWIGLDDSTRSEAADVLSELSARGLAVELLTGDGSARGPALSASLGITRANYGQTPEGKMAHVQELQVSGAVVAMVGDGLNDAPVLSLADASFAVAGATDLARTQADFVLVGGGLGQVVRTWKTARRCRGIIAQNLAWALTYNLCALPLAVAGLVPPWAAAIGMSLSSLLVVLNSLRLNNPSPD